MAIVSPGKPYTRLIIRQGFSLPEIPLSNCRVIISYRLIFDVSNFSTNNKSLSFNVGYIDNPETRFISNTHTRNIKTILMIVMTKIKFIYGFRACLCSSFRILRRFCSATIVARHNSNSS